MYLDMPGWTGNSPYQLVYGRTRLMEGLAYPEVRGFEAEEWFRQQADLASLTQRRLQELQDEKIEAANRRRPEAKVHKVGDKVWLRRQVESKEAHLRSPWTGPYVVIDRVGDQSYVVGVGTARRFEVHVSKLKVYEEDTVTGRTLPLYFYRKTEGESPEADDTWKNNQILNHKVVRGNSSCWSVWRGAKRVRMPGSRSKTSFMSTAHRLLST